MSYTSKRKARLQKLVPKDVVRKQRANNRSPVLYRLDNWSTLKVEWLCRYSRENTANTVRKIKWNRKNFIQLGIEQGPVYAWSCKWMEDWAITQSPKLKITITISRLKRQGYKSILDYDSTLQPSIWWISMNESCCDNSINKTKCLVEMRESKNQFPLGKKKRTCVGNANASQVLRGNHWAL